MAAMQVALRVLTAINERHNPAPEDLEELRRLLPEIDLPSDELACKVVQDALAIRRHERERKSKKRSV